TKVQPPGLVERAAGWVRQNPRRAFLAAALGAVAAVGLGAYRGYGVDWLDEELRRSEGAALFDSSGAPRHLRWITGQGLGQANQEKDGTFRVTAQAPAMVELARCPHLGAFRFQCRVRHDLSTSAVYIGLYFGHRVYQVEGRSLHFFVDLTFND